MFGLISAQQEFLREVTDSVISSALPDTLRGEVSPFKRSHFIQDHKWRDGGSNFSKLWLKSLVYYLDINEYLHNS